MDLRDQLQSTLGNAYSLERELGGGGMSRVFVAEERRLKRKVVVKVLAPELAAGLSAERFEREIQLAAGLQHPQIVPVLSAGDTGGLPFYVMPFIDGESLRTRLAQGPFPCREAIDVLRDVAKALAFAHARGVVHRDIKPDNVLLAGGSAVVTDFGIAKAISASRTLAPPGAAPTLTEMGVTLGTPAYMAPEQVAGDPAVDHRADLYSFGCLAYELLTGNPPFGDRPHAALFAAHLTERPTSVAERRPESPAALVALVGRCLEKDPAARPATAAELVAALDIAASELVTPRGGSPSAPRTDDRSSIAVLPFANLSPDPDDEFFADGLTDEVITDLSSVASLRVIARASMMRFKRTEKDPAAVARELNVRYALDGSVRRAGSSLRLTARLTDATTGATIWSDKLGGSLEDVFAIQEKVSRTIVEALSVTLRPQEDRRLAARPIADLRAYEYYLQARQSMWLFTVESMDRARQQVASALAIVGDNALLFAALGQVHAMYLETGQGDPAPHIAEVERCVRRLSELSPDAFGLHWLRGLLHYRRGEIKEAIASMEQAHAIEPNNADVVAYLCYAYIIAGRDDPAREAAAEGVALDPLTPLLQIMPGFCEWVAGRFDRALPYYRRYPAIDPLNPSAHLFLVLTLVHGGLRREALEVAQGVARQFPATAFGQLGLAFAFALEGRMPEARAVVTPELRTASRQSEMFGRILSDLYAVIGDADATIDALENAVRLGLTHYPYLAQHNHLLDPFRGNPRLGRLLELVRGRWERGGASAADHALTPSP